MKYLFSHLQKDRLFLLLMNVLILLKKQINYLSNNIVEFHFAHNKIKGVIMINLINALTNRLYYKLICNFTKIF